ncbi:hypothetical protein JMN32_15815 [Fulvivirga sp. 29W222]|uniref:Lipocalin-like domain-containing protein n=1 Tax=Fulvivirga marina TaxID=2494733 RepID=A0A937G0B5_9BACT|nr:hypothetical protein [Fulvivirga marina]MBL6447786.1 hypothetical protein [Fulvivirga marina]
MKTVFLFMALVFYSHISEAQQLLGLWEITQVEVADKVMTPVAKWTNIKEDGTYESGNGWLRNSEGTWSYDEKSAQLSNTENIGVRERYDPFVVSFEGEVMVWKRKEDGMEVVVKLRRISELPMSTADKLHGLWDLQEATQGDEVITSTLDKDNKYYFFFRWDRIFEQRTEEGNVLTGYWHINGHRPEITLLSHQPDIQPESWKVEFDQGQMKLSGLSESNQGLVLAFKRLHEFPD